jgi:hypothetical protein
MKRSRILSFSAMTFGQMLYTVKDRASANWGPD